MEHIAKALAAAQMEMGKALKQSANPHFRSKYADLGNVMDACMPALNKHGIAVFQTLSEGEYGRSVLTRLIHESGEMLEVPVPLIVGKQDMQGLGSAITYARRYGLMAAAGIAPEDDDGNAASQAAQNTEPKGFSDTVIAELPPDAPNAEKAEAVADAMIALWKRKTTPQQLNNAWDRLDKAGDIPRLKRVADQFDRVADAFEARMNDLNPSESEKIPA